MESVTSKIQETGQHVVKKSDVLLTRTREAGEAFFGEVREAGRELVVLVRGEAKGWRRFLVQRTSALESEAKGLFARKALERQILLQVDGALRSLEAKVHARLTTLEKRGSRGRRSTNGAARRGARKARAAATAKAAAPNGSSTLAVRH